MELGTSPMSRDDEFNQPFSRPGERDAGGLRRIVRYQRWLIAVVLAQLALWLGFLVLTGLGRDVGRGAMQFPVALTLILGAVGAVFVFLIMWELQGVVAAAGFGLATLFPCIGLLVITLANGYATTELKKYGVRVGLFGASTEDVEDRPSPYDVDEDAGW